MEYVTIYAPLKHKFDDGYIVSAPDGKVPLIIIEETLTAEERRKRLAEIVRRYELE